MRAMVDVRVWMWALLTIVAAGCGDSGTPGPEIDPAVEPFVGTWDAEVFDVTSDADTSIVADITESGSFTINIQPSGTYTATLVFGGITIRPEIGELSVDGCSVTLRPIGGEPATSEFTFLEPDYLRLEGPTEFDFNLDDVPEAAQALIEVRRR